MIRHEIMVKRTKQEIDRLADEMIEAWRAGGNKSSIAALRSKAIQLIFNCLPGSIDDYQESRADG